MKRSVPASACRPLVKAAPAASALSLNLLERSESGARGFVSTKMKSVACAPSCNPKFTPPRATISGAPQRPRLSAPVRHDPPAVVEAKNESTLQRGGNHDDATRSRDQVGGELLGHSGSFLEDDARVFQAVRDFFPLGVCCGGTEEGGDDGSHSGLVEQM